VHSGDQGQEEEKLIRNRGKPSSASGTRTRNVMVLYVAFLRGINSGQNPVQKMENLRRIFEGLGFLNVRTVIASGNVLFETDSPDKKALEEKVEKAMLDETGIGTVTVIRTREEIKELVGRDPFGNVKLTPTMKPYATFLKNPSAPQERFQAKGTGYTIISIHDSVVFSVVDLSSTRTPVLMSDLEKELGKDITTRSWATILKIASRFGD
jgi:uncharacterized protein (DUF1697 family)